MTDCNDIATRDSDHWRLIIAVFIFSTNISYCGQVPVFLFYKVSIRQELFVVNALLLLIILVTTVARIQWRKLLSFSFYIFSCSSPCFVVGILLSLLILMLAFILLLIIGTENCRHSLVGIARHIIETSECRMLIVKIFQWAADCRNIERTVNCRHIMKGFAYFMELFIPGSTASKLLIVLNSMRTVNCKHIFFAVV